MATDQTPSSDALKSEILSSIRDEAAQRIPGGSEASVYYKEPNYTKKGYSKDIDKPKRSQQQQRPEAPSSKLHHPFPVFTVQSCQGIYRHTPSCASQEH